MPTDITLTPFTAVRIRLEADRPYEAVLASLLDQIGHTPVDLAQAVRDHDTWETYSAFIEQHLGPSGFMLMWQVDHGAWLRKVNLQRRVIRIVLGNPLLAWTMLKEDPASGLFVPVEVLVMEETIDRTSISYLRPSSLMLVDPNPRLAEAASVLDGKLDKLIVDLFR